MTTIIAIDPGDSGGLAWRMEMGSIGCMKMPDTDGGVMGILRDMFVPGAVAYLEKVGGFAGQGQPGSAMFNFGDGNGFLRGCLMALGYRVEMVTPQKWQKAMGIGNASQLLPADIKQRTPEQQKLLRRAAKQEWKRKLRERAEHLYPCQKVTLATCDALLILDYAIRNTETRR